MSGRINIEPDQLKELASELGQRERECGTLTDLLEWNHSLTRSVYPEMDGTYSGALYQGLAQKLTQYRSLLDEAQAVVKRTEMEFRQLDEGFLSKLGQFGLDMVGYYDVIRIGAEYDPLTGEKLSGWDHLIAGGWTAFNLASFGLGGLAAKGAVKLFKSVKNVLHTSVVGGMLKGAFNAAKSGILSGVYRAGQALKNVTLFPEFRMVTGDGRLISTPPVKVDDLVQRFSKGGIDAPEKGSGLGTEATGDIVTERAQKAGLDLTPKPSPYKQLGYKTKKKLEEKVENRTITKEEWKRLEWNKRLASRRDEGVENFWDQERARIRNDEQTTREWSQEQIKNILNNKAPTFNGETITGHHAYSVSKYPHLADRGEIIYPATIKEHLKRWHGGSYRQSLPGKPMNPLFPEEF